MALIVTNVLLACIMGLLMGAMGASFFRSPKDDTDPPNGHSGMRLFVDHKTGCHYVGNPMGGIIPRLDGKGRHICEPKAEGRK